MGPEAALFAAALAFFHTSEFALALAFQWPYVGLKCASSQRQPSSAP